MPDEPTTKLTDAEKKAAWHAEQMAMHEANLASKQEEDK